MVNNGSITTVIIFINYGPYHLARAKALGEERGLTPVFIQLAKSIGSHPWRPTESYPEVSLKTLSELPFERSRYLELSRSLWKALDEINPAVVVTTSFRPFIMLSAARWARYNGKRAVFFYETTRWDRSRLRITEALKRWTIGRYYDAAFVGGKVHREYLAELGMSECRIWEPYDVVDNDHFANTAAAVRADLESWRARLRLPERYFLYVGRYAPEKNLVRLLEAYGLYRKRQPGSWSLVLVGDGPERDRLQDFVASNRIEDVFLERFAQIEDLPAYYALAGCFVLASTVDPWGLVVNEAMASGLPVLVSKLCGSGFDLVEEGGNGFRFDPYDIRSMAELFVRMSSLDEDTRQRMGQLSRKIISRFTPRIWAENLARCIRSVTRKNLQGEMGPIFSSDP